jgi:hypothetical protein
VASSQAKQPGERDLSGHRSLPLGAQGKKAWAESAKGACLFHLTFRLILQNVVG